MIPCEFDIVYIEDYSQRITYNELNSLYPLYPSMTFCIFIFYIYNEYKYIKSYICLDILYGSNSSVSKFQRHYCENYKDIYELQAIKNVNSYILMPLGIKINNKNVFLISSYNNIYSYNNICSNIVFFHNYIFKYTHLKLKNDILNQYTIFNDIILKKYNIAKNIFASKNILTEMR